MKMPKWQQFVLLAAVSLLISYTLAATMPDYAIRNNVASETFMQFWHFAFSLVTGVGSVVFSALALSELFGGSET